MDLVDFLRLAGLYSAYSAVIYCLFLCTYRIAFHPLRHIPGPFFAKLTDAYGGVHAFRKHLHLVEHGNHAKYGPVYRQGPNRLLFNTITAVDGIYRNPRVDKSSIYLLARQTSKGNIWDTPDPEEHRRKRKIISLPLAERSLRKFEPTIIQETGIFIHQLAKAGSSPINISNNVRNLMCDIVGHLSFGYPLETQTKEDNRWLLPGLGVASWRNNIQMQFPPLKKTEPMIKGLIKKQRQKFLDIIERMIRARLRLEKNAQHDFYSFAIEHMEIGHGMSESELWAEAFFFIIAGGATTTAAISAMVFYLLHHRQCYQKLVTEIRSTFSQSAEIRSGDKLNGCKYLRACINETLRIASPVTGVSWREQLPSDDGPLIIDGYLIPKGTLIGIQQYAIHHNPEYFPDPYVFNPERWLGPDSEDKTMMHKAFTPFNAGNRSCSGKALAYLELSIVMARTLWQFDLEALPGSLGRVGGGEVGSPNGRERPDEFQLYDTFSAAHDGPYFICRGRDI